MYYADETDGCGEGADDGAVFGGEKEIPGGGEDDFGYYIRCKIITCKSNQQPILHNIKCNILKEE